MGTKYCDQGQETASITIANIEYITELPPLYVEQGNGYKYLNLIVRRAQGVTTEEEIPMTRTIQYGDYSVTVNGKQDNLPTNIRLTLNVIGKRNNVSSTIGTFVHFYPYTNLDGNYNPEGLTNIFVEDRLFSTPLLIARDEGGNILCSIDGNPGYQIKCDGCQPGDCKASKSKYPGYVCLDCAELSDRLKRIGQKLDGKNG